MTENLSSPVRGAAHAALAVFLGEWEASGLSYGGPRQDPHAPKAHPQPWASRHRGYWHTGGFFLLQDERATVGGAPFDTLAVMGVGAKPGRWFAQCYENHGFQRHYEVLVEERLWIFSGHTERARIEFSEDGATQTIAWEWRRGDAWLPLCDRVARRLHTTASPQWQTLPERD